MSELEPEALHLTLFDNAVDYLLAAAEYASAASPRDWKYALLHLASGVELLLKARLNHEHWSLLFSDVDKASAQALRKGDFKSVDFDEVLNRLTRIGGIDLGEPAMRHLRDLRGLRNRVQHFAVDVEVTATRSLVARNLNFAVDFAHRHLAEDFEARRDERVSRLFEYLGQFDEFVHERLAAVKPQLDGAGLIIECRVCEQPALALGLGKPHCAFCNATWEPEELAEMLTEDPMDDECLACGSRAIAYVLFDSELGTDLCAQCGAFTWTCRNCRTRFTKGKECPACHQAID